MAARVLVTRAGTGASNNLIRSLKSGDPSLFVAGCHDDRFVLKKSLADRNYLVRPHGDPGFGESLSRVVAAEGIDLIIPTTDSTVRTVSALRGRLACRLFLPRHEVIELCQDKYELTIRLRSRGVPAPLTYPVTDLDGIDELFHLLGPSDLLWCRVRTGSGSVGALPVRAPEQARSWTRYWEDMRGVPATAFTLSEHLPGRDFFCQGLWNAGRLVLIKTCERLSYFVSGAEPSGVSSVSALARTVFEPGVVEVCTAAVRVLDSDATGAFNFDLKEDATGRPCITEINAGRFVSGTNILDLTGKHNMAVTYVRLALGEPVEIREEYDVAEAFYSVRDLDAVPGIFHADELFAGIEDARE
jgi:hypothetical protein